MKEDVRLYNVDCKIFITTSRSAMWDVVCLSNSSQFSCFTFKMTLLELGDNKTSQLTEERGRGHHWRPPVQSDGQNTQLFLGRRVAGGPSQASPFDKDKNFSTFYKQVMFVVKAIFRVYKDVLCLLCWSLSNQNIGQTDCTLLIIWPSQYNQYNIRNAPSPNFLICYN